MAGNLYGYVRVSTQDQNEERQMVAMRQLAIPRKNLFLDKQSGKDFARAEYQKMVKRLRRGDLLYIKSIDRLGRNYEEIQNQWRILTKDKRVDVVLQVLSFVAENERSSIRQRQAEGIAAAKARGVRFGPPASALPDGFEELRQAWREGRITLREAACACDIPKSTFYDAAIRTERAKKP